MRPDTGINFKKGGEKKITQKYIYIKMSMEKQ